MCKTNALDKKETSTGSVREIPQIKKKAKKKKKKKKKEASTGCLRETPKIAMKTARDM